MARSETWANAELAKGSVASSTALHRTWMEPSRTTCVRVTTSQPRSIIGKLLHMLWSAC